MGGTTGRKDLRRARWRQKLAAAVAVEVPEPLSLSDQIDQAIHETADAWGTARLRKTVTGRSDKETRALLELAHTAVAALKTIATDPRITPAERPHLVAAVEGCRRVFGWVFDTPPPGAEPGGGGAADAPPPWLQSNS